MVTKAFIGLAHYGSSFHYSQHNFKCSKSKQLNWQLTCQEIPNLPKWKRVAHPGVKSKNQTTRAHVQQQVGRASKVEEQTILSPEKVLSILGTWIRYQTQNKIKTIHYCSCNLTLF